MIRYRSIVTWLAAHWFSVSLLVLAALLVGAFWTPYPAELARVLFGEPKVVERIVEVPVERVVEKVVEVPVPQKVPDDATGEPWKPEELVAPTTVQLPPFPPVLPESLSTGTFEQFTALARGLHLRSVIRFNPGSTASQDRRNRGAYMLHVSVELLLPHAADGKELLHANPELPHALRQYDALMAAARVSRWYNAIYLHKQNAVRRSLASLAQPLDKHNFFDVDTILEITAPETNRHVLWIQADMDVVSDGSDGDRLPTMPERILQSSNYQPTTSYRWRKLGDKPNPLLPGWEARLAKLLKEKPRKDAAIDTAKRVIYDLKRYSYLLAQYDPFIVIPLTLKEGRDDTYRPAPGDYAAVIVGKKIYPAIVGDYGPRSKAGEASLRLGKMINPAADIYARPVSSLGASYIIFPHTAEEPAGPLDYERLNARCRELIDEVGGMADGAEFVEMKDLLVPPAPPPQPPAEESSTPEKGTETTPPPDSSPPKDHPSVEKDKKKTTDPKKAPAKPRKTVPATGNKKKK